MARVWWEHTTDEIMPKSFGFIIAKGLLKKDVLVLMQSVTSASMLQKITTIAVLSVDRK